MRFLILVPIAFLLLALTRMPYGYYDVMRIVVSLVTSVFLIKECIAFFKHKTWERAVLWSLIFVGIVLLFNPLAPFRFPRQTWTLFNIGAAILLFIYFLSYEFKLRDKTKAGVKPTISSGTAKSAVVTKRQVGQNSLSSVDGYFDQSTEPKIITRLDEHRKVLERAFSTAKKSVVIVSPYLTKRALLDDNIEKNISDAVRRNVNVKVICDPDSTVNIANPRFRECVNDLKRSGAEIYQSRHHSKVIIVDVDRLVVGSFNWLSASRDPRHAKGETSNSYSGVEASERISKLLIELIGCNRIT